MTLALDVGLDDNKYTASVLAKTDYTPGSDLIHNIIRKDRDRYCRRPDALRLYRDYTEGEQKLTLNKEQIQILEAVLGNQFCDNVCDLVVSLAADRLELLRLESANTGLHKFIQTVYIASELEDRSGEVHYASMRDGNTVVAAGWDSLEGRVEIYPEEWWDGIEGVFLAYSASRKMVYGVKEWCGGSTGERRRNIWFPDRLERWGSANAGASWERISLPEDKGQWPIPWVKDDGSPLHIPYIHFPNTGRGSARYGKSELAGGGLGFQDQINDAHYAITIAAQMTGFQMYFFSGVKQELDPVTKEPKPIPVGPGYSHSSPDPNSRATALQAGNIDQLIKVLSTKKQAMAQSTRTPYHLISGGDWPTGEALLRAEQPAVGKATKHIKKFRPAWATVMHRAVEISNRFGRTHYEESIEKGLITAIFAPPERRDALSMSVMVNNMGDRSSRRHGLRMMGETPERAEEIWKEKLEEEKAIIELQPTPPLPTTTGANSIADRTARGDAQQQDNPQTSGDKPNPTGQGTNGSVSTKPQG